ncbi:MAG: hypothetical protein J3K34DRAFT_54745 [Monoraphidium minutum]|nr:MAG: hypothetical protein J3K34DRAFT_54745 [Monoraphidium minutum]
MPPLHFQSGVLRRSRRWHISSDDLPIPAAAGLLFHGSWCVIILVQFLVEGPPVECSQRAWAESTTYLLFGSFLLTACMQAWLLAESLKGSIMDEHARRRVPAAAAACVACWALELGALAFTTAVWVTRFGAGAQDPGVGAALDPCRRDAGIDDRAFANVLLASTWAALLGIALLAVLLYNVYPDQNLQGWADRCAARNSRAAGATRAARRRAAPPRRRRRRRAKGRT